MREAPDDDLQEVTVSIGLGLGGQLAITLTGDSDRIYGCFSEAGLELIGAVMNGQIVGKYESLPG